MANDSAAARKVLVVDDEPPIRVLIEGFLRSAGYHVVSTGEPREVLDLAMKQVTHEDSRLRIVTVSGRELLKRDRF